MNLVIVSWNIQGKYSIAQLIDRLLENGWDLLIVLEPQQGRFDNVSHQDILVDKEHVRHQYIYLLRQQAAIPRFSIYSQVIMQGERSALVLEIPASQRVSYSFLTS